jgi:hypothetical protein
LPSDPTRKIPNTDHAEHDQRDSASRRDETWKKLRKRCGKSADLDVFPEADAVGDRLHFFAWTLIDPGVARMALAVRSGADGAASLRRTRF